MKENTKDKIVALVVLAILLASSLFMHIKGEKGDELKGFLYSLSKLSRY